MWISESLVMDIFVTNSISLKIFFYLFKFNNFPYHIIASIWLSFTSLSSFSGYVLSFYFKNIYLLARKYFVLYLPLFERPHTLKRTLTKTPASFSILSSSLWCLSTGKGVFIFLSLLMTFHLFSTRSVCVLKNGMREWNKV